MERQVYILISYFLHFDTMLYSVSFETKAHRNVQRPTDSSTYYKTLHCPHINFGLKSMEQ